MREFPMATSPNSAAAGVASRNRRRFILLAIASVFLVLALVAFFRVGRWLVVEDPVDKARAIVVLSGRMPVRALEAAKLYRQGYAPEVWLTHTSEPGESLKAMGISFEGEEVYSTRVLIHEGVPAGAIHVLETPIVNTADEVRVISGALERENNRSVILVTSKPHTRRVRLLWRKLAPSDCHAIVRAASDDPFDPRHWWRSTGDALDVVREVLGLMNAWAGLPLTRTR
jgi:uncharacterized SAM-binding protein YcdF (DUF218 family)